MADITTQMAPIPDPSTPHQKQYVFVDEYNRHKRLKVMRACDGCRRRKIRCDGALQNGPWPCGSCVRLKLKCVPPTLDQDDAESTPDSATSQHSFSFQNMTFPTSNPTISRQKGVTSQPQILHKWTPSAGPTVSAAAPTSSPVSRSDSGTSEYSHQGFHQQLDPRLDPSYSDDEYFPPTAGPAQFQQSHPAPSLLQQSHPAPSLLRSQTAESSSSGGDPLEVDATVRELSEQMGDLQIDITSAAPYIANHKRHATDTPGPEEVDVVLPPSVYTNSTVHIPVEMMPSEERALDYFGYYFDHIHAYAPVLNKAAFYDQWHTARSTISPLILEGIFACVARYLEEPLEVRKWLALASRHEERFKDVPRLATIQAMVILMKARESLPKPGYYYRSWMAMKYMVTMGFDLGLNEHYDQHRSGNTCTLSKSDCLVNNRIWQTLFVLEILVGAPMGRSDFSIEIETVPFNLPISSLDVDGFEHQMSRRATFMAQNVRNIKQSSMLWLTMRKYNKDWALDTAFVKHNEDLPHWLHSLPADMQIHYPDDGSPPWLGGDHYLASLHVYHHLVVMIHHRPQLQALLDKGDPAFKSHLDICLTSATHMCRLQEALYRDFGIHGLQFFPRGLNFTIYCVLTCTMLHLAAITSPDPVLNSQARTFFTRHMRVLERCLPSASPDMIVQINALREAFSADTSKAFELKSTLGLRSPSPKSHHTPSSTSPGPTSAPIRSTTAWSNMQDGTPGPVMSPSDYGSSYGHVPYQISASHGVLPYSTVSYEMPAQPSYTHQQLPPLNTTSHNGYALEPSLSNDSHTPIWDPSGIFNQWNHAFGGAPQVPPPMATPPDPRSLPPTSAPVMLHQHSPTDAQGIYLAQQQPGGHVIPATSNPAAIPTVTPVMWQDAFTQAYVTGKRHREASVDHSAYAGTQYKRRG